MFYADFTGKGWITYALVPLTFVVGVAVGLGLDRSPGQKLVGAGIAAVIIAVVGAVAQWTIGRAYNGDTAKLGWIHVEHTTHGVPMELTAPFYPVIGSVMLSFVVGAGTSPAWGWMLFLATAGAAALLLRAARRRRPPR
jgi:hypothetical protein